MTKVNKKKARASAYQQLKTALEAPMFEGEYEITRVSNDAWEIWKNGIGYGDYVGVICYHPESNRWGISHNLWLTGVDQFQYTNPKSAIISWEKAIKATLENRK